MVAARTAVEDIEPDVCLTSMGRIAIAVSESRTTGPQVPRCLKEAKDVTIIVRN
jgi:hypothetical protein